MAATPDAPAKVRLYVSAALAPGGSVELEPGQVHYLLRVMRLSQGERIRLFNGCDGEWQGRLAPHGRAKVAVEVERRTRAQDADDGPWLAFAPVKKSATDFIVEKATELGAARILPVLTERTIAQRVNVERLQATATEAAEQCGRLSVPEVAAPLTLPSFVAMWPAQRPLCVAHPQARDAALPLLDALTGPASASALPAGFLVGPEGGLTSVELDGLAALRCVKVVSLGTRTLRAETAAVAVLAVWQALNERSCAAATPPHFKDNPGQA
ncbi:MAG: 16S rRNA (uracil(1498)-N(3))-methyltransferase [Rhodospirillales bacterium]|nr:16S rRNA (uracil(1498)-N(3))-methyltransferase [Rhodospirillales bacterium]